MPSFSYDNYLRGQKEVSNEERGVFNFHVSNHIRQEDKNNNYKIVSQLDFSTHGFYKYIITKQKETLLND